MESRMKDPFVAAKYLRLHMGELTAAEVRIARAAYRLGYFDAVADSSPIPYEVTQSGRDALGEGGNG